MKSNLLLILLLISGISNTSAAIFKRLPSGTVISFLDISAGQNELVNDVKYPFFSLLTSKDISAQLKEPVSHLSREEAIDRLKIKLKNQVLDWTEVEIELIEKGMQLSFKAINSLHPNLMPDTIQMIKITGDVYGTKSNYTVNKAIVLTQFVSSKTDTMYIAGVLNHELYHIISRTNKTLRQALYAQLGFRPMESFVMGEYLSANRLTNPDCQDPYYFFTCSDSLGNDTYFAIVNNTTSLNVGSKDQQINFLASGFYEVDLKQGKWFVKNHLDKPAPVDMRKYPCLRQKIGNITNYMTNQEEIAAMYFTKLAEENLNPGYLNKYSKEDRARLNQFVNVIKGILIELPEEY